MTDMETMKQVGEVVKCFAHDRDRDVRLNSMAGSESERLQDVLFDDQIDEGDEKRFN